MLADLQEEFPEDVPDPYDDEADEYASEEQDIEDAPDTDRAALETGRKLLSSPQADSFKPPAKIFAEFNEDFTVPQDPRFAKLAFDESFPGLDTSTARSKPRAYDPEEYNPRYLNEADIIFAQRDLEEKKRNEEMFQKRSNVGFVTLGFASIFAFGLSFWQLYLMNVNRRSIEIDDYLLAVQSWKNEHRYPFESL